MDNICEQLVEKRKTGKDIAKIAAICAGSALCAAACVFFTFYNGMIILLYAAIIPILLAIWLLMSVNVEYEYIVTNNEMDIDKIIGRRKRKRMITVDLNKTEDFGEYPPKTEPDVEATVHATSGVKLDAHYLVVRHKSYGKVMIIFNPSEKLREAIAQEFPKSVSANLQLYGK